MNIPVENHVWDDLNNKKTCLIMGGIPSDLLAEGEKVKVHQIKDFRNSMECVVVGRPVALVDDELSLFKIRSCTI